MINSALVVLCSAEVKQEIEQWAHDFTTSPESMLLAGMYLLKQAERHEIQEALIFSAIANDPTLSIQSSFTLEVTVRDAYNAHHLGAKMQKDFPYAPDEMYRGVNTENAIESMLQYPAITAEQFDWLLTQKEVKSWNIFAKRNIV